MYSLALFGSVLALVRTVEKLSVEQLNGDNGEYELQRNIIRFSQCRPMSERLQCFTQYVVMYVRTVSYLEQHVDDEDVEHILE